METADSTTGPYQNLFGNICNIYNQKLFNKEHRGTIQISIELSFRPKGVALSKFLDLYQHTSFTIAEYYRLIGGGMINRQKGKWTHEVDYSHDENEFFF